MARVNLDQLVINATSRARGLALVRQTTEQIKHVATYSAPRGTHHSGNDRPVPGPTLQQSIASSITHMAESVTGVVLASANYAMTVERGSKPHMIVAKGKLLTFRWPKGDANPRLRHRRKASGMYVFVSVKHPGNRHPQLFLTTPLRVFGTANGFKVRINKST